MSEPNPQQSQPISVGPKSPTTASTPPSKSAGWSPTAKADAPTVSSANKPAFSAPPKAPSAKPLPFAKILIALAILGGGMMVFNSESEETKSPNWTLHEKAGQGSSGHLVNQTGEVVPNIVLSSADENPRLLAQAKASANPLQMAQVIQSQQPPNVQISPDIGTQISAKINSGQTKFYDVQIWDTCAEDGDVVDVMVDGVVFATVTLMHAPTTVSIPCGPGTSVGIGARIDGGGGVTLGAKTSVGQYFTPILSPGDTLPLSLAY
jgi:hypothetical protein